MKNFICIILYISTLSLYAQRDGNHPAQSDANIFGHVLDRKTKEHLPYVTIKLQGTTIGITTDASGHYFLRNLPTGNFRLEASMIGYKTFTREVTIRPNSTLEIDFELEEENVSLDAVVISANRNETTRRMAPSLVSVLNMQTLNVTNSKTLSDGLKFQPGLRVENNCQNCGTTQVRINGMEGSYSQILIDSRPMVGALSGVYGLEQIPANMIERIEVVRGGGSALFGANAIGGTINIITREPIRNTGEFAHTLSGIHDSGALENNTTFNASLVNDSRNAGIMVYGQHRLRDGVDMDGDGFTELPLLKNRSLGFRSFLKTGVYSRLTLEYRNLHEFRRGGDQLKLQPFESYITEQVEHYINSGSLNFDRYSADQRHKLTLYAAASHTDRESYYGAGEPYDKNIPPAEPDMNQAELDEIYNAIANNLLRINSFGNTAELTYQLGGHYIHSFDNLGFMPADLTAGLEYTGSNLEDESGYRAVDIAQNTRTASSFLQNEWKTAMWSFLIGGRLDKHNLVKHAIFSPRLNLRYNPTENINVRLTYSGGFRAPQVFDENLHVDIAGGKQVIRILSDDLIEERSKSISGSVDLYHQSGASLFNLLVEGFYTQLENPFTEVKRGNEIIIENAGYGAKVYGMNLEGRAVFGKLLDLQAGATIQRSLYDEERKWWEPANAQEEPLDEVTPTRRMMRTPDNYAYFVATLTPVNRLSVSLSGNYTGSMLVPHEAGFGVEGKDRFSRVNITEESPSFFELNTKIAYTFNLYYDTQLELNAGVQNMLDAYQKDFDTGAGRASSYIYGPGMPRTFFAGLKVTL
ncbi:MAG: TonB-dependent receptor [Proteiniphilum sp.]|jgi:outer membrane receptor for ferrienterochelin and colicins|nr:TonB-dependent receptor [Proteiniphilum sp.]MDD2937387.1 TonB-dependent receptor [Proteiniphilum sp.]MDD3955323.1 TonB-dependent receptor [Proteiniphilum sp.]MDD4451587.1 TonB-dependent receptor [Proteiniphilum sp.]